MSDAADRFTELAERMRQEAEALTTAALWRNAQEQVAALPLTPSEVEIKNSNTTTELWKRGMAPWQRTKW